MIETIKEKLIRELAHMPKDKKDIPSWKMAVSRKVGCHITYVEKVIRWYSGDVPDPE